MNHDTNLGHHGVEECRPRTQSIETRSSTKLNQKKKRSILHYLSENSPNNEMERKRLVSKDQHSSYKKTVHFEAPDQYSSFSPSTSSIPSNPLSKLDLESSISLNTKLTPYQGHQVKSSPSTEQEWIDQLTSSLNNRKGKDSASITAIRHLSNMPSQAGVDSCSIQDQPFSLNTCDFGSSDDDGGLNDSQPKHDPGFPFNFNALDQIKMEASTPDFDKSISADAMLSKVVPVDKLSGKYFQDLKRNLSHFQINHRHHKPKSAREFYKWINFSLNENELIQTPCDPASYHTGKEDYRRDIYYVFTQLKFLEHPNLYNSTYLKGFLNDELKTRWHTNLSQFGHDVSKDSGYWPIPFDMNRLEIFAKLDGTFADGLRHLQQNLTFSFNEEDDEDDPPPVYSIMPPLGILEDNQLKSILEPKSDDPIDAVPHWQDFSVGYPTHESIPCDFTCISSPLSIRGESCSINGSGDRPESILHCSTHSHGLSQKKVNQVLKEQAPLFTNLYPALSGSIMNYQVTIPLDIVTKKDMTVYNIITCALYMEIERSWAKMFKFVIQEHDRLSDPNRPTWHGSSKREQDQWDRYMKKYTEKCSNQTDGNVALDQLKNYNGKDSQSFPSLSNQGDAEPSSSQEDESSSSWSQDDDALMMDHSNEQQVDLSLPFPNSLEEINYSHQACYDRANQSHLLSKDPVLNSLPQSLTRLNSSTDCTLRNPSGDHLINIERNIFSYWAHIVDLKQASVADSFNASPLKTKDHPPPMVIDAATQSLLTMQMYEWTTNLIDEILEDDQASDSFHFLDEVEPAWQDILEEMPLGHKVGSVVEVLQKLEAPDEVVNIVSSKMKAIYNDVDFQKLWSVPTKHKRQKTKSSLPKIKRKKD